MGRRVSSPTPTNEYRLAVRRIICDACGDPLHVAHQAQRTIRRLNGVWRLTLVFHRCLNHHCRRYRKLCRPEEEGTWALPHGEFGFDVIALIGQRGSGQHRSIPEIHQDLRGHGLEIAERTVTNLLARYDELLALRLTDAASLQERLIEQGRVVLGLDGLKPDVGHEVLWVVRDCLSGDVLVARTLLSEAEKELSDLLQEVQALLPVPITGVISDGQHSIRNAVHSILPDVPHQLCQYHYLREAVKPLYEADRHAKKELKKAVREIRPIERTLEGVLREQKITTPEYLAKLTPQEATIAQGYCLAIRSALTDDGHPPLCAAGLRLADRLSSIAASLQRVLQKEGISQGLLFLLERIQKRMQQGLTHASTDWSTLRQAYALVYRASHLLNNEEGLPGEEVCQRYTQLLNETHQVIDAPDGNPLLLSWYATFLKVTANYGEALFVCYALADLPHTNNDLEHLFGSIRYHERRTSGRKQVAATLLLRGKARVLASVSTRLRTYQAADLPPHDIARWRTLRRDIDARQETRRKQRRFRQDPEDYLQALEAQCEQLMQPKDVEKLME